MNNLIRWIWVLACLVLATLAVDKCQRQERCDACIQTPGCMWCSNPKSEDGNNTALYHCQPDTLDPSSFCELNGLENPQNSQNVTVDVPLTTPDGEKSGRSADENIVQLSPQGMKLKLRKGMPETFNVTYRQAMDYPVDLYYMMDLTNSMTDDKENLAALGGKLTEALRDLTTQFTIGFGSFTDKFLMPYAETSPEEIEKKTCDGCSAPYAFKNNLPLGNDSNMFTRRVKEANIAARLAVDGPEGGFDALMQAMVCKSAIGWRNQSRRIIIFSTDQPSYSAGDGRLAGIITPNDEQCHLNGEAEYDAYDKYDYPSIAQINKVSKRENINIIFAVSAYEELYEEVSKLIETSSYGLMNSDSSNVVDLVINQYKQISSKIRLSDNSTNSPISIKYSSSCLDGSSLVPTDECSGLSQGSEVTFNLEVTVKECPKDQENIVIEVKTLQDSLFLEIEFDCNCNCEVEGRIDNSTACSHKGALVCGVCDCHEGYQGHKCMCSIYDASDGREEDETLCTAPNATSVCSNSGKCTCGACACYSEEITGQYCQCNRAKCQQCSGHGVCDCDKCQCEDGYYGSYCECPPDDVCINPESGYEICSGNGECKCGKCQCNQTYSGRYCDDCLNCKTTKCDDFQECVQCFFRSSQCPCNQTITSVDTLEPHIANEAAQECTFVDPADDCYFKFSYLYDTHKQDYEIHVLQQKECPEPVAIMGPLLGLVAGIVMIGLLTLIIWKIFTSIQDKKEYARFASDCKEGVWCQENDLYENPVQTTVNPLHSQRT